MDGMLQNVYNFYLNHGKKRNPYHYVKYRKFERLITEIECILDKISLIQPLTYQNLQDIIHWQYVLWTIILKNSNLIKNKCPRSGLVTCAQEKLANRFEVILNNFTTQSIGQTN
jgi:hypothetical protein